MQSGPPFTFLCFGFWMMGLFFKFQLAGNASSQEVTDDLRVRFDALCQRLKLTELRLLISPRSKVSGSVLRNEIFVTKQALLELSPPAIEFILGHELAHRKFFNVKPAVTKVRPKWLIGVAVCLALVPLVSLRLDLPWIYYIIICLPFVGALTYSTWKNPNAASAAGPDMELACDFISINIMCDPKSALEVLGALTYGSKLDRKVFGYPSPEARLGQVQRFLAGEPRPPFKNKFVEENVQRIIAELEPSKLPELQ